jgi:hypothetical protein
VARGLKPQSTLKSIDDYGIGVGGPIAKGRAEAVRAVVAAGASIAAHVRSALFSVLSDNGTPSSLDVQQIADQRRAIGTFGAGFACA